MAILGMAGETELTIGPDKKLPLQGDTELFYIKI